MLCFFFDIVKKLHQKFKTNTKNWKLIERNWCNTFQLYALWFGSNIESNDDDQLYETDEHGSTESLLAEAALRSGGEWIIVRGEPGVSAQVSSEEMLPADQPDDHIVRLRYDRNNIAS